MKTPIKIALIVTVLVVIAALAFIETIPPRSMTAGRMHVTKRRILQFAREHNKLPPTLADLPLMPGYDTQTVDAWKRPLDYSYDASDVVTLRSFGADKRPGGAGEDRDMTGVFISRDVKGRWQDESVEWKQDPFKP